MKIVDKIFAEYEAKFGKPVDRFTWLELLSLQHELAELQEDIYRAQKAINELKLVAVVREVK